MPETKTYIYFKNYTLFFITYLYLLKFLGIFNFSKVKKESKRIIIYSNQDSETKIKALRKLFFGFNFFSIHRIETNY